MQQMATQKQTWKVFLTQSGEISSFTGRFFHQVHKKRFEAVEFIKQCFVIGYQS